MSGHRALRALLAKLGRYATNLDADSVATDLWRGKLTLTNVRLRPEAFGDAASVGLTGESAGAVRPRRAPHAGISRAR